MEHVERQDEREQEIRGDLDELEGRADEMQEGADRLEGRAGELREDFERKQQSADAPGLQEDEGTGIVDRPSPDREPEDDDE